jgi:hypothetical protein
VDFSTRAVADVGHLMRFRARRVRRRSTHRLVLTVMFGGTLLVAAVPAFTPGAGDLDHGKALAVLTLLPVAFAGFLAVAVVSAVVSGGGRELLPRDQATPYPISPTTDHLGALLLAPVNTAWLLQAWLLLGSTAYGVGATWKLVTAQVVVLLWLLVATSIAQVVAWTMEAVRRRRHGIAIMRTLSVALLASAVWLHVKDQLVPVLDRLPTVWFVVGAIDGFSWRWALTVAVEVAIGAVFVGVFPAHLAARRSARDELRVESEIRESRPNPRSDLSALVRTDRASVWRTVPMRRGLLVLAIGPGLVAIAGNLPWHAMTILPGLVASGGALLFGVNAWCLDGRGGLWRESLPVSPRTVFTARTIVLTEFLLIASVITIVLASLRAGIPSPPELAALVATLVVVTVQVAAAGLRWSARRPFAVDLRSARATPAPPVVMVGYSARLAISTTVTGLVFSVLARTPSWEISVLMAIPFLAWSTARLLRSAHAWTDPVQRARVVVSVAA